MKKSFEIKNTSINYKKCSLEELNRELKRLSSGKCRLGWTVDGSGHRKELNAFGQQIEARMQELTAVKAERFEGKSSSKWLNLTDEQIAELSLEDLGKAIASISSKLSRYGADDETLKLGAKLRDARDRKKKLQLFEELQAELS